MRWPLWRGKRRDEELEEEIAHDLRLDAEERMQSGLLRPDAEQASQRDFGNVLLIKEEARATWSYQVMATGVAQIAYDIRHALRRCTRTPTFTVTALAVLALGIAANVVVFSIANAVLLKPLAFPNPDRVVIFQTISPTDADVSASPVMYAHWRRQTNVVQDVAAFQTARLTDWTSATNTDQIWVNRVSADYFRLFGASMARGRTFTDQEDRPGGDAVIILSHDLWMQRFGGADVIGQGMNLNGASYTIIGVLDASFRVDGFGLGHAPDAWLPSQIDPASKTLAHFFSVSARLRPGVTLAHAQEEVRFSTDEFRRDVPNTLSKSGAFSVEPLQEALVGSTRPLFFVLLGAVVFVLLIACSNLANLLLLQGASRWRELAVRAAIGAARSRIVRQLLTESLLLSVSGGAIGLALGWVVIRVLLSMGLSGLPRLNDATAVTLDWRVIAFTVTVSIATGVLFGLAPALRVSRVDLSSAARTADGRPSPESGRRRAESVLVVLQVSLALVLLIGSALFMRTVFALTRVDAGFDPDHVLALRASLSGPEFAATTQADVIVRRGMEALGAVPGVAIVGAAYGLPLEGGGGLPFEIVGRPLPAGQSYHGGASWQAVSAGYFEALRIPVVRGRDFTASDGQQAPAVMLINDVMARRYWPHEDPLGQHVVPGHGVGQFQDEPVREIVGIVGSIRENQLDRQPGAEMYEPLAQLPDVTNAFMASGPSMAWIVRTTLPPEALARTLPQALQRATRLPVQDVYSMDEVVLHSILRQRLSMWLMAGFGVAALLLAAIGLYGLVAHSVEQRTREIGIRLALGAEAFRVRRMVIWQGMRLTIAGTVVGLLAALALTRVIARLLFNVQAWDPSTFVIVPVLVAMVAALAVWWPARRASRVNPIVALRYE
jgi:putative ABC transport system permease protein